MSLAFCFFFCFFAFCVTALAAFFYLLFLLFCYSFSALDVHSQKTRTSSWPRAFFSFVAAASIFWEWEMLLLCICIWMCVWVFLFQAHCILTPSFSSPVVVVVVAIVVGAASLPMRIDRYIYTYSLFCVLIVVCTVCALLLLLFLCLIRFLLLCVAVCYCCCCCFPLFSCTEHQSMNSTHFSSVRMYVLWFFFGSSLLSYVIPLDDFYNKILWHMCVWVRVCSFRRYWCVCVRFCVDMVKAMVVEKAQPCFCLLLACALFQIFRFIYLYFKL